MEIPKILDRIFEVRNPNETEIFKCTSSGMFFLLFSFFFYACSLDLNSFFSLIESRQSVFLFFFLNLFSQLPAPKLENALRKIPF